MHTSKDLYMSILILDKNARFYDTPHAVFLNTWINFKVS